MRWTLADWKAGVDFEFSRLEEGCDIVAACEEGCEGSFSWSACELCGCALGGERHSAAIIKPGTDTEPIYLDVCVDCLCFLANGDEPTYLAEN